MLPGSFISPPQRAPHWGGEMNDLRNEVVKGLVSRETVALSRLGSKTQKFGIEQVDKGQISTVR